MVIVGTVDGNRVWSKDVGTRLSHIEWSPNGQALVFATADGPIFVYNHQGVRVGSLLPHAVTDLLKPTSDLSTALLPPELRVVALEWYDGAEGYVVPDCRSLGVAFANGRVQLMRGLDDETPVCLDTALSPLVAAKWNSNGSVFAVAGQSVQLDGRKTSEVQFYLPDGRFLNSLKVPGGTVNSISWEGGGLRLALAVDHFVYLASVRPVYLWAAFGDVIVYAFSKQEKVETAVVFWNTRTDERYIKYVKHLLAVCGAGENCVLIAAVDAETAAAEGGATGNTFAVVLCNAIGSPIETRHTTVSPDFFTMTDSHIVIASSSMLYLWNYRVVLPKVAGESAAASAAAARSSGVSGRDTTFNIDDGGTATATSAICCVTASSKMLLVGRENGVVQQYSLPDVKVERAHRLRCRPSLLSLNCDSDRFAVIELRPDGSNVLHMFDLEARSVSSNGDPVVGAHLDFERKDVWSIIWASDAPDMCAIMEKTRMYVLRNLDAEEPILSSGYLARFSDLSITSIMLDDVMVTPEAPNASAHVVRHEVRSLRDTRTLLDKNTLRDSISFVEEKKHPRLWRLLAETALDRCDLGVAEKAFVSCSDYPGIQFVKRLRVLGDRTKQKAEIMASFARFDEAEDIHRRADRQDLAIELRMRIGDWQRVITLLEAGGGDDELVRLARNRLGDFYADRKMWDSAIPLYRRVGNFEALVETYYIVEDYTSLVALIGTLHDGHPLLLRIGALLRSVGMSEHAANALLKGGDFKAAVDTCVHLNQWDRAIELAEIHKLPQIQGLLHKYGKKLLEEKRTIEAIELYQKANLRTESAQLLAKLAAENGALRTNPLRTKQLFVLAALDVEAHRRHAFSLAPSGSTSAAAAAATQLGIPAAGTTAAAAAGTNALATMLAHEARAATVAHAGATMAAAAEALGSSTSTSATAAEKIALQTLDRAWHGAEAFHFLLVAQRHLYAGDASSALAAALRLTSYEDVLDPCDVYSLVAVTSFYNLSFGAASRAFVKLENMESLSAAARAAYADLALTIFSRTKPEDPLDNAANSVTCPAPACKAVIKAWSLKCPHCSALARFRAPALFSLCHTHTHLTLRAPRPPSPHPQISLSSPASQPAAQFSRPVQSARS